MYGKINLETILLLMAVDVCFVVNGKIDTAFFYVKTALVRFCIMKSFILLLVLRAFPNNFL